MPSQCRRPISDDGDHDVAKPAIDRYLPVVTGDTDWDRAQHELARLLNLILGNPMFRTRVLINVTLASGANRIDHGLGRVPTFVLAIAYTAGVVVTDEKETTEHTDRLVSVRASGATNATLIVG